MTKIGSFLDLKDIIYALYDGDVEDELDAVQMRRKIQKKCSKSWAGRMEDGSESNRETVFMAD